MAQELTGEFVREGYDIRLVARRQRLMIWLVLGAILGTCSPLYVSPFGALPGDPLIWGAMVFFVIAVLRLSVIVGAILVMRSLRTHVLLICLLALLMFVPLINLLVLLFENRRATKLLRKYGLRVRLMGVRDDDVVRQLAKDLCHTCGYNLTGNVSGICPECGTPLPVSVRAIAS